MRYLLPVMVIAALLLGTFTVMALENRGLVLTNRLVLKDTEKLKEMIPETFEATEAKILPIRNRFIMWTHDGKHVMWGYYGNGYLTGTDNNGKRAWGIYGKHVFAGFYDGEFFYGRYWRGRWKAIGLFGLEKAHGRYVLFPGIRPIPVEVAVAE